jgi:hypothetical protein
MEYVAAVVRYVAFGLMLVFGVVAGAFVVGVTFDDPGGAGAVALTAAWLLPLVALSVFAFLRPDGAVPVLVGLTALVGLFVALDASLGLVPRGQGPVDAVAVFALGVALGVLGLHRPRPAGFLLLLLAGMMLVGLAGSVLAHGGEQGAGTLGGSSGVVTVPAILVGALFMLAGTLEPPQAVSDTPSAEERPASSRATGTRNGEQDT